MKDKIICLVGESGSGKSTLADLLEKEGLNYIRSYTTRKPRYDNEDGHIFVDYIPTVLNHDFISQEQIYNNGIIAYTYFDNNYYWATKEQYKDKGVSIYVVDPSGVENLKNVIKDAEIVAVYLKTDKEERIKRMSKKRECQSIINRINHEDKAFKLVKCDYVINNNGNVLETLDILKEIIWR